MYGEYGFTIFSHNIRFYAATAFFGILTKSSGSIQAKSGFWTGIWQRTTRIGKYSRRRRRFAYTDTLRVSQNPSKRFRHNPMGKPPGNL